MSYIAIDLGTTNTKVIVYSDALVPLAEQSAKVVYFKEENRVEFDLDLYIDSLLSLIKNCCEKAFDHKPYPIAQIVLTGQAESLVALDKNNRPVRRAISWLDMRSQAECEELRNAFDAEVSYHITGKQDVIPTWPVTKILWLKRHEPDNFNKTAKYLLLKDYVQYVLCGEMIGEHSIYNFTHYFDIISKSYWTDMLRYCGIRENQLPQTVIPCTMIGFIRADLARELGISPNAKINVGTLDHFAGMIGTGNIRPGIISESTGTVLAIASLIDEPLFTPERLQLLCGPFDGTYVFLPVCESGGMSLEWYRNTFMKDASFEDINKGCENKKLPGAMICLPYLTGANGPDFNLDAAGVFFGFKEHSDKYDFALAVMEGVAHMLNNNIKHLAATGLKTRSIISTGGGAKSPLWCQMKADITGYTVKVPETAEAACLGAAMIGAVSEGQYPDYKSAVAAHVKMKKEYQPLRHEEYAFKSELYDRVYGSLQDSYHLLARWQQK